MRCQHCKGFNNIYLMNLPELSKLGPKIINPTENPAPGDDSKRWPRTTTKTETRCVTLIDGVFQLKTESFKPQAVKKALTVLLLSCQHHLISTEQITCASLTNLISLFFFFPPACGDFLSLMHYSDKRLPGVF